MFTPKFSVEVLSKQQKEGGEQLVICIGQDILWYDKNQK